MSLFKKKDKVYAKPDWKITKDCLDLILESAKSIYPNEFGGLLRVDVDEKHTIIEIIILPGTVSGDSHAIFKLHMLPIDFTVIGTVHSHPSPSFYPSEADTFLFRKHGKVHIIAAYPFTRQTWQAYDHNGDEIEVKII